MSSRLRFVLWVIGVVALALALALQMRAGLKIETSVLALLPPTERDPVVAKAVDEFTRKMSNRMLFLVGHPDQTKAGETAQIIYDRISGSGIFDEATGPVDDGLERDFYDLYFPFRYQILGKKTRHILAGEDPLETLGAESEKRLYSPMSSFYSRFLDDDPLLLFPDFLESLPKPPGKLNLRNGWLGAEDGGNHYILITALCKEDAFGRRAQGAWRTLHSQLKDNLPTEAKLYVTGVLPYAEAGASQGEEEASTIGLGSMLGVVFLFLIVFRSPRPLFLGLLPIFAGLLTALTVSFTFFPKVHLLTLGFGASLIGVCIDYSFHYFCEQYHGGKSNPLKHILSAISLGALTSVIGYLGLAAAPFPGLRQMALFSCAGLIGAWLTVVCCFPMFSGAAKTQTIPAPARALLSLWRNPSFLRFVKPLAIILALAIALGLYLLKAGDDIRALQKPPQHLKAQELQIRQLAGGPDVSRFLLVEGDTPDQTLQNQERLTRILNESVETGELEWFQTLSGFLPSNARQKQNRDTLKAGLTDLESWMNEMEFEPEIIANTQKTLESEPKHLDTQSWLAHPASKNLRHLWLGQTERGHAAMALLGTIRDDNLISRIQDLPGVTYIDKVADYSSLMTRYRVIASWLVFASYLIIFLVLVSRYGLRRGVRVTLPPVTAGLTALALFGLLGAPVNLFNLLALLLVLGIGVDYTIFFAEAGESQGPTMTAVMLSATTTILAFGLLALSQTPVLHTFGLTLLTGVATALFLAPMAARRIS